MATASTGDESNVAVLRISTVLRPCCLANGGIQRSSKTPCQRSPHDHNIPGYTALVTKSEEVSWDYLKPEIFAEGMLVRGFLGAGFWGRNACQRFSWSRILGKECLSEVVEALKNLTKNLELWGI